MWSVRWKFWKRSHRNVAAYSVEMRLITAKQLHLSSMISDPDVWDALHWNCRRRTKMEVRKIGEIKEELKATTETELQQLFRNTVQMSVLV